jgi:hypothetical protein
MARLGRVASLVVMPRLGRVASLVVMARLDRFASLVVMARLDRAIHAIDVALPACAPRPHSPAGLDRPVKPGEDKVRRPEPPLA